VFDIVVERMVFRLVNSGVFEEDDVEQSLVCTRVRTNDLSVDNHSYAFL
jgi:hypothetical protein